MIFDEVEGLVVNSVNVGGITSIGTEQSHLHTVDSEGDGEDGPSDASEAGQQVTFNIVTSDVLQGIPLLIATPASAVWYGHEVGVATYGKGSLVNPVCHALSFDSRLGGYAAITVQGDCQFPNAAATYDDVEGFVIGQPPPSLTHPSRQWQPHNAVHGSFTAYEIMGLTFGVRGKVRRHYRGNDKGVTTVAVAGYGLVEVTLTIRDTQVQAGPPSHDFGAALMNNGVQNLVVDFEGVGDTADKTLTLRNCKFRGKRKTAGRDWTGHTLNGVLQWRDPSGGTIRKLDDATPANRLINWA